MFEKIYRHLKNNGINVFSIGQHEGLCVSPYVVIKRNSSSPISHSLVYDIFDIILFYPLAAFSEVEYFEKTVWTALKSIKELKFTHETTPIIIDTDKQAYTTSQKYQVYKRRES